MELLEEQCVWALVKSFTIQYQSTSKTKQTNKQHVGCCPENASLWDLGGSETLHYLGSSSSISTHVEIKNNNSILKVR